jgi:hypothetical protein
MPMNIRPAIQCSKSFWIPTIIALSSLAPMSRADEAGEKSVAEVRQALRKDGFRLDLSDFDFSTSPELRAREVILMDAVLEPPLTNRYNSSVINRGYGSVRPIQPSFIFSEMNSPDLMEAFGSNSAPVVWRLASPDSHMRPRPRTRLGYSWDAFRKAIDAKGHPLDRACAAIFAGPIRFELTGRVIRSHQFTHLLPMQSLTELLNNRLVLELHDGNLAAAWTNLLASTRLVTAWEPQPPQACHMARFGRTELAFEATWQALQTNWWSDAQLAQLQAEWESVDFFTRLPDTAAYERVSAALRCQQARLTPDSDVSLGEFMAWGLRFPEFLWEGLDEQWRGKQYRQHGSYVDETAGLLYYRDSELELRRAIQVATWSDMGRLPSVSRPRPFTTWVGNKDLLRYAAVAETQRRILIAALALERYRLRNGAYPQALPDLVPEFTRKPAIDFMDGRPLRYRLENSGHFFVYSVGLDCVDKGFNSLGDSAIVWPLPTVE